MNSETTKQFTYDYPMASLAVDIIIHDLKKQNFLFIRRKSNPFQGKLALPGGFVNENEKLEDAAKRELYEETNLLGGTMFDVCVLSDPLRDERGRIISFVFSSFYLLEDMKKAVAKDDAESFEIINIKDINDESKFAFDHYKALEKFLNPKDYNYFL